MATYGWIIDKDYLAEEGEEAGTNLNAVGVIGPRGIPARIEERLRAGQGRAFRMFDDDGELYYSGRIITSKADEGSETDFGPLQDFGTPNAGCTFIQYLEKGKWETL